MSQEKRKELLNLIKKIPENKIQSAINLLESLLIFEKEYEELQIGLKIRSERLKEMIDLLREDEDMINADFILSEDYYGQKQPREDVERYVSTYIDTLNHHIMILNFFSLFKSLYKSDYVHLIEKPDFLKNKM